MPKLQDLEVDEWKTFRQVFFLFFFLSLSFRKAQARYQLRQKNEKKLETQRIIMNEQAKRVWLTR